MVSMNVEEASAKLGQLLDEALATGEALEITRNGLTVALLVPKVAKVSRQGRLLDDETLEQVRKLRQHAPVVSREEILEAIDEGRK